LLWFLRRLKSNHHIDTTQYASSIKNLKRQKFTASSTALNTQDYSNDAFYAKHFHGPPCSRKIVASDWNFWAATAHDARNSEVKHTKYVNGQNR
jgi:hypothetical protein